MVWLRSENRHKVLNPTLAPCAGIPDCISASVMSPFYSSTAMICLRLASVFDELWSPPSQLSTTRACVRTRRRLLMALDTLTQEPRRRTAAAQAAINRRNNPIRQNRGMSLRPPCRPPSPAWTFKSEMLRKRVYLPIQPQWQTLLCGFKEIWVLLRCNISGNQIME